MSPANPFQSILILCEGNHCRSPMAEALFRSALGSEVRVESAGLRALQGRPADAEMQGLLKEHGIDISEHQGRQCTPAMIRQADLILVMEQRQKHWCEDLVPSARGRVFLLGHWLGHPPCEIDDPFTRRPKAFHLTYELVSRSVAGWLSRMTLTQRST